MAYYYGIMVYGIIYTIEIKIVIKTIYNLCFIKS